MQEKVGAPFICELSLLSTCFLKKFAALMGQDSSSRLSSAKVTCDEAEGMKLYLLIN